jgi:hypothetical protein
LLQLPILNLLACPIPLLVRSNSEEEPGWRSAGPAPLYTSVDVQSIFAATPAQKTVACCSAKAIFCSRPARFGCPFAVVLVSAGVCCLWRRFRWLCLRIQKSRSWRKRLSDWHPALSHGSQASAVRQSRILELALLLPVQPKRFELPTPFGRERRAACYAKHSEPAVKKEFDSRKRAPPRDWGAQEWSAVAEPRRPIQPLSDPPALSPI